MTIGTLEGKSRFLVVGIGRTLVIFTMAGNTIVPQSIKSQLAFRNVTIKTLCRGMCTNQRESIVLMYARYVVNQPVFRMMTTRTVLSNGLLMDICMAGNAVRLSLPEYKCGMTRPAIHRAMPSFQLEIGGGMVEHHVLPHGLPTIGRMAVGTLQRKGRAMRRLGAQ